MNKSANIYMKKIVLAAALVLSLAFIASAHAQSAPQCVVNYFTTSSNSISYGTSVSISWNTSNCSTVSVYGGSINNSNYLPTTGSIQTNPIYNTTTFTLNASGNYNSAPTQNLTIFVNNQNNYQQYYNNTYQTYTPCVISSFSASPVSVVSGNSTTLTWNTVGCTTVTLTGPNISNTNQIPNGSISTGALYGPAT
jgi:hypothetical protein